MQCVCCLLKSENKKELSVFTASDKKLHHELTRIEISGKHRICAKCKSSLKDSAEFARSCVKSYEELCATSTTSESVTESLNAQNERPRRTKRKVKEEQEIEDDHEDCAAGDDSIVGDDELPVIEIEEEVNYEVQKEEIIREVSPDPVQETAKKSAKFLCPDCGLPFQTAQRLQVHSFTHSGIKNYKCDDCEKVFATKFRLKAHSRIHTGERPYVCDVCSLRFAQGNALKCHKRVHTKERPFVCKICSKSFSQNTTLKTHMAALHLGKTVECDEPGCDKKFTRRSYLLIHKRDHAGERKYACDRCPNQYKQKSHLDRHIEASHLGVRHKCNFPGCNSEFSKSWSLKMHKFSHASDIRELPYQCESCDAGFQRRDKLLKHIAKDHSNALSVNIKTAPNTVAAIQDVSTDMNRDNSNYVVLTSSPEIYTIQNPDGSFTQVQTLQVIESVK